MAKKPSKDTHETGMLVSKQEHHIAQFTTFSGKRLKDIKVGWESYGELNKEKSNAILITHYFTGNSHAAGRYTLDDTEPGYWDSIIGPNKAIDTNTFFVISVDSLVNINAFDKNVITTGPASINPDTQKAYGLSFPVVTIRDFVNTQKSVLERLGIQKLHAVVGPSMGSMQAIEWASAYPDWVERVISVIGSAATDPWNSCLLEQWTVPITTDKNYHNGNYYHLDKSQWPQQGLIHSLCMITQSALHPLYFTQIGEQISSLPVEQTVLEDIRQKPSIVNWLVTLATQRSTYMDANHLLYLVRANQLFVCGMQNDLDRGLANLKAKTLLLPAANDQLLMPYHAEKMLKVLKQKKQIVEIEYLCSDMGHLAGLTDVYQQADRIQTFLHS